MKVQNLKSKVAIVLGLAVVAATQAHAALDAAAQAAITSVSGSMTDLLPAMYLAMGTVTGGFVVFGLIKKGIRKVA